MRAPRGLLGDYRGSATTEGVIVAFFLAIVFGSAIWVARLSVGSLALGREVRAQIDGPSFEGANTGELDLARTRHFAPAQPLAARWVPLREESLSTIRIDRARGSKQTRVDRPVPIGGGSEALRWEGSRQLNEIPRAGAEGNWPAMLDTWERTGMTRL